MQKTISPIDNQVYIEREYHSGKIEETLRNSVKAQRSWGYLNVKERVKTIAPFLEVIGNPYLVSTVIDNKNLDYDNNQNQYWIVECYTTSRTYPYASNLPDGNPIRYIRNSVKAIVDAYNGNVKL